MLHAWTSAKRRDVPPTDSILSAITSVLWAVVAGVWHGIVIHPMFPTTLLRYVVSPFGWLSGTLIVVVLGGT